MIDCFWESRREYKEHLNAKKDVVESTLRKEDRSTSFESLDSKER